MSVLGRMTEVAVAVVRAVLPGVPGSQVVWGVYTPTGGTGRSVPAVVLRDDRATQLGKSKIQRLGATVRLFMADVPEQPPRGSSFAEDVAGVTWVLERVRRDLGLWTCEAALA